VTEKYWLICEKGSCNYGDHDRRTYSFDTLEEVYIEIEKWMRMDLDASFQLIKGKSLDINTGVIRI
jgi:hypothetical protein